MVRYIGGNTMGRWGAGLYENDLSLDVHDSCMNLWKQGKEETVVPDMVKAFYQEIIKSEDSSDDFMLALAETMHSVGRMDELIKEAALERISEALERLNSSDSDFNRQRIIELLRIKSILLSPQSPKRDLRIQLNPCIWKINEVYALPFISDEAVHKKLYGKYMLFHVIGSCASTGKCMNPIVRVKITQKEQIPTSLSEINDLEYVQIGTVLYENRFLPFDGRRSRNEIIEERSKIDYKTDEYGFLEVYQAKIGITTKRTQPTNIQFIGTFEGLTPPAIEFVPHDVINISWIPSKRIEENIIRYYYGNNCRNFECYKTSNKY